MTKKEKHDRQKAIENATLLFWEKGFHGTSMRNIQEFIDMRPGSIYASFGNKEGLFKEALHSYTDSSLEQLAACLEASSPLDALKSFIENSVVAQETTAPSDMCMLVKTVSELTEDHADLLAETRRLLAKIEDAFTAILTLAKSRGELDETQDPRRLARFLQMQMMGLRAYARTNRENANIHELVEDAFTCLH